MSHMDKPNSPNQPNIAPEMEECVGVAIISKPLNTGNGQPRNIQDRLDGMSGEMDEEEDPNLQYFHLFFSPRETADAIQRRNDNLQMLGFQNSDQEPDDVYNRRKKKVCDLMTKGEQQTRQMKDLRRTNYGKYVAILEFVKFFCLIKQRIPGIRTDYYSNKTFCALKNATEQELRKALNALMKMHDNIFNSPPPISTSSSINSRTFEIDERVIEFLILPRFLISREKINRLWKDEELQENFQFLVNQECLGHYNNEANKKMPERKQMTLIKELLRGVNGHEKFKKICSINHGNKFLKSHGHDYYALYQKSLEYLRHLDSSIKKGKKYDYIKKDLEKLKTEETFPNSSFTGLQSSLSSIDLEEQLRDKLSISEDLSNPSSFVPMRKNKVKKLMSVPTEGIEVKEPERKFKVKKHSSACVYTENIILVPPPQNAQI